jgi:hypothetical protein
MPMVPRVLPYNLCNFICIFFIYKKKKHRFPTSTCLSQRRSPVSFAGLLQLLPLLLPLLQQRFRKRHP